MIDALFEFLFDTVFAFVGGLFDAMSRRAKWGCAILVVLLIVAFAAWVWRNS